MASMTKVLDSALTNSDKMLSYIDAGSREVISAALDLKENDVGTSSIVELQESMKVLIQAERRVKAVSNGIMELRKQWDDGEIEDHELDVVGVYEEHLQRNMEYDEDEVWSNNLMKNFIKELSNNDPDMTKVLQPDHLQTASQDDSQEVVATTTNSMAKCPLTQTEINEPVRDKICGHIFEKSAVLDYLNTCKTRRKQPKCVLVGCSNIIASSNLEPVRAFRRDAQRTNLFDITLQ